MSLPFHRANGEVFKSLFDLYRERLTPMIEAGPRSKAHWRRAWLYLQYHQLECPKCRQAWDAAVPECPDCGTPLVGLQSSDESPRSRPRP